MNVITVSVKLYLSVLKDQTNLYIVEQDFDVTSVNTGILQKLFFNGHVEQNMRNKYKFVNWEYKVTLQSALKMKQIYTYRSNVWM